MLDLPIQSLLPHAGTNTMKQMLRSIPCLLAIGSIGVATAPAQAHFKLLKPASWIVESASGDPQKAGPCGPDESGGMMTNEITTVEAGSTIEVEFNETIHHPGWFRISLAEDRGEFEEIEFPNRNNCNYDMSTVPEEPHGNVLVDGLAKDENLGGANRMFKEMVKIPDTPCEKCTLQVIQVMADAIHSPPGCIYYHCADLKIVAAAGGTAGDAAAAGAGGSEAAADSGDSAAGAAAAEGGAAGGAPVAAAAGSSAADSSAAPATMSSGTAGTGTATGSATASTGTAGKAAGATTTTTSAGSTGATSSGTTTPATPTTGSEPAMAEKGGCAVANPGARSDLAMVSMLSVVGLLLGRRRRQRTPAE